MLAALVLNAPELDTEVKESVIIAADGGYRHVKNATDGELAIEYAASRGITELNVYGGLGGKPEHVAGNLNLLAFASGKGIRAKLVTRDCTVYYATGAFRVLAGKGAAVSVFAYGGEALIDGSEGLYYPYDELVIAPSSSRGISNVATADEIAFEVKRGAVLVFVRRA